MKKEDTIGFLNSRDGKVNIILLFFIAVIFVFMILSFSSVKGMVIALNDTFNLSYNNSRNINFTFTVIWSNDVENVSNCSLYTNASGRWDISRNFTNTTQTGDTATDTRITNNSLSYVNFTFSADGNFTWNIGCYNRNESAGGAEILNFSGGLGGSGNRTFFIDSLPPTIILNTPFPTSLGGLLNITSNGTDVFYVNISDNTTNTVWYILNSQATFGGYFGHYGTVGDTNESVNRTMTLDTSIATGSPHLRRYNISVLNLFNFSSNFTGPGPHGLYFCANDTFGRRTCSDKVDFIIKGMGCGNLESQFGTGGNNLQHSEHGFSFSGLDIRFGNGTDFPSGNFLDPTTANLTFNINFTDSLGVFIVGAKINESAMGSASRTNFSNEVSTTAKSQAGNRYSSNMTWTDIGSFIPSEVSYQFGIIQMKGTFNKVMFCNGTSTQSPSCLRIYECNSTRINIFNHTEIIPTNGACYLTGGGGASWGVNITQDGTILTSGFTYIFVDHFSGGLGASDFGPPNVTFFSPLTDLNKTINRSTTVTQLINFTVDDTDSTGLNLTANFSINVTITLGGSTLAQFNYINLTNSTNLTCTTADVVSPQNTTRITCNVTFAFNSNGTYTVNVTGRDAGNNSNAMNTTTNYIYITVDQIPPISIYYNFTNSTTFNTTRDGGNAANARAYQLGTNSDLNARAQGDALTGKIIVVANWTDNLTNANIGALQFYNTSKASGQEWQTINVTAVNGSDGAFRNGGWTNISFIVPSGHNEFEGENVSFRVVTNDTLGNVNSSAQVKNFTILINDTTKPTLLVTIGSGVAVNDTNITDTTPTIVWNVTEPNALRYVAIQIDGSTDQSCNKFVNFTTATGINVETRRNFTIIVSSDGTCPLGNGTSVVRLTSEDTWGNSELYIHSFTIETGSPNISLSTIENITGPGFTAGISAVNQSNVTPRIGINFTAVNGRTSKLKNFTWTSTCNTSTQVIASSSTDFLVQNLTLIYPFLNISSCANTEANRTVTITVSDEAGNTKSDLFRFAVDDLGPTINVHSPTNGDVISNIVQVNVSALDKMNRVDSIRYYLDGDDISNLKNHTINGSLLTIAQGYNTSILNRSINFTPGTHTIKISVNDSMGNVRNSSVITFTQTGPVTFSEVNTSVESYIATVFNNNLTNVSIRIKTSAGTFENILAPNETSTNTFEILFDMAGAINISLTDFNGSKANWDKINFTPYINKSNEEAFVQANWTNTVLNSTWFNNSISEFLPDNNSYYGTVVFRLNDSGRTAAGPEFWWIENEGTVTTRTNISRCGVGSAPTVFTRTTTTPCWNYTSGGRTIVYVPHFSVVAAVNDSSAPTINVTTPLGNQTVSMFEPNITVSSDTAICRYQTNSSSPTNRTMVLSGTKCIGETERFKNLEAVVGYNITFWVTDNNGNTNQYLWLFNISDTTAPNNGEVTSSGTTTGATITITGTNESVNATVFYGTSNTSLSSSAISGGEDFNVTQTVTVSGIATVTSAVTYYYNITACDFNGNCKNNGTFTFSQTATAAAAAAAAAAASTSGGGGAAAPSNEAASTSRKWDNLPAGSSAVLTINNANIAVTGVVVDVKNAVSSAEVKVASLNSNPISTAAAAKVYQYLQLTKSNVADTDASKITINFKVPKSWLTSNNVAEDSVVLYRFSDSKWNSLSTTKTGSDANNVLYSAVTPGFSTFAIGSKEAAPAVTTPAAEERPAEVPVPTGEVPKEMEKEVAPPAPEIKPAMSSTTIALIVIAVIVVIAAVGYFMMQKKKE